MLTNAYELAARHGLPPSIIHPKLGFCLLTKIQGRCPVYQQPAKYYTLVQAS